MHWWMPFLLMIMINTNFYTITNGERIKPIHWNSSNPIFFHDNTNHIFVVRILDSVEIICPKYNVDVSKDFVEYSVIHMVDKFGYDSCKTNNATLIGFCNTPYAIDSSIIIVFREFTPNPNGLEFRPDQDYYFISTSNGTESGLWQRKGGLCDRKNMKLRFEVKHRHAKINNEQQPAVQINAKKPTKPQKQPVNSQNADNDGGNSYDDDDYDNDEQIGNDKISQSIFSHGNGNKDDTKYTWSQHETVFSASQSFQTWLQSRVYATSTPPNNQNEKSKNFSPLGPPQSSSVVCLLLLMCINLVFLLYFL